MAKERQTELERLMENVSGIHSKRMNAILLTMDDEDFTVNFFKALEYSAPKLQRREIVETDKSMNITVTHITENVDKEGEKN
jgi:site-specific DNA-cytosine methylase